MEVYKMQNDNSSVARMLKKLLKKFRFNTDPSRFLSLSVMLAQTLSDMSQPSKGLEIIDDLISKYENTALTTTADLILCACDIYLANNDPKSLIEFLGKEKIRNVCEKAWTGEETVQAFYIKVREAIAWVLDNQEDGITMQVNKVIQMVAEVNQKGDVKIVFDKYQRIMSKLIFVQLQSNL